ncbi:hypothetical protein KP509_12G060800 [Ceratopteris richardii]|uniref:Rhodanese domain-containing protein n=1 Tax=Ceratopteris richardii TaxID=49495 RepID=A0A8T2TSP5_CERRI|nr:hypothetical protein KP509_12G060800 [Ceratopteris richardii]KAH7423550.1 hypothetical protein KP509_12G060800 [Ceratopteris richardii]
MASLTAGAFSPSATASSSLSVKSSLSITPCSSLQSAFLFSPLKAVPLQSGSTGFFPKHTIKFRLNIRSEVKYVDGLEAKRLVSEEGYTVLDIRDRTQYEKAHIVPSTHIPVYIENTDNDINTIINRTLHNNFSGLFYGLAFTKPNPNFVSSVKETFSDDRKLLLVCQEGLRSGAAAQQLEKAGFRNLAYINAGLQKVAPGIFDKEGPKELQDAGKGGLVTVQGKISTVLGTVLVAALLFITFFPNQAEQWFFTK